MDSGNNQGDEHQTLEAKISQLNLEGQAETDDKKGIVKKLLKPTGQVGDQLKDAELDSKADNESTNEEDSDKCQQDNQPDQHSDGECHTDEVPIYHNGDHDHLDHCGSDSDLDYYDGNYDDYGDDDDDGNTGTCFGCGCWEPHGCNCEYQDDDY